MNPTLRSTACALCAPLVLLAGLAHAQSATPDPTRGQNPPSTTAPTGSNAAGGSSGGAMPPGPAPAGRQPPMGASAPAAGAMPMGTGASAAAAPAMARDDRNFLRDATEGGMAEVRAGQMALAKGTDPQVKRFAQQMVDDHTKANQELMALASGKGVQLPDEPSLAQKTQARMLEAADGASFDRKYSDAMVEDHRKTVALFQNAAGSARDADVKAFAQKTLPTLQHHLEMAQSLQSTMKSKAVTSR